MTQEEYAKLFTRKSTRLYAGARTNHTTQDAANRAYQDMTERGGINDTTILRNLARQGYDSQTAADGIALAREWMRNPAQLQRSVGSDSYVDGATRRSTI